MLGGADNANGELPSYITGANITLVLMPTPMLIIAITNKVGARNKRGLILSANNPEPNFDIPYSM